MIQTNAPKVTKLRAKTYFITVLSIFMSTFVFTAAMAIERDQFGRAQIPEIMALKDGQAIPAAVFQMYDSRAIGESIVARIALNRTKTRYNPVPFDFLRHGQLQYFFSLRDFKPEELLKNGILNIFQLDEKKQSNLNYVARRVRHRRTADKLAGINLDEKAEQYIDLVNKVRPKYVGLDVDIGNELKYSTEGLDYWGEITVVLKPKVMQRATYTAFDSGAFDHGYAGPKREVRTFSEPSMYAPSKGVSQYFEAQVWGELDIHDIQEFLVPKGLNQKNLDSFIKFGLPIYEYKEVMEFGRYRRIRNKLLFEGSHSDQENDFTNSTGSRIRRQCLSFFST